ncbi:MAG TPA: cobyric acid synthase [Actinomycetota bacterium]|nr:cobyric acid synthase [Actinomycetota bacterium]
MNGALLVAGATSDAGKSVLTAGICRWLHRQGVAVAPFKAQNMSLNSGVTPDGAEIARAQLVQAAAAGIPPEAAMNPVLLKPTSDRESQLIVMGQAQGGVEAGHYRRGTLLGVVLTALDDLRRRFDVVVCEGAGGIAEINLRAGDLANLGLAEPAGLPVLVVCDIDRGGVFASAFGSLALLSPADQARVQGFLINRFRGDPALLEPGIAELERRTGRPVLGVVPWLAELAHALDAEDSLALERPPPPAGGEAALEVAVIRFPRISNFTDLDPLAAEPGVRVRYTADAGVVAGADLVVLPGTKSTVADLDWLRGRRLDQALVARGRAGGPILAICGGYQMLGERIVDGVESRRGELPGLALLPVSTVFTEDKVLARPSGSASAFGDEPVSGYEIHHGRVSRAGGEPLFQVSATGGAAERATGGAGFEEGCRAGAVLGTCWHGVLERDGFRRAVLSWVAATRAIDWEPGSRPFASIREARLDVLGDLITRHVDTTALTRLIEGGGAAALPVVKTRLVKTRLVKTRLVEARLAEARLAGGGAGLPC